MKYTALTLLVAAVQADAPPAFNEPPFAVKTHPSASGLLQLDSACMRSGFAGVTCGPSDEQLFADGAKGDIDLGLHIQMKGDQFDTYKQKLIQLNDPSENNLFAIGEAGDAELKLKIQMKGNQFDTYKQTLVKLNGDGEEEAAKPAPKKVEVLEPEKVFVTDPKIAKSHTTFYNRQ